MKLSNDLKSEYWKSETPVISDLATFVPTFVQKQWEEEKQVLPSHEERAMEGLGRAREMEWAHDVQSGGAERGIGGEGERGVGEV